ncbi:MAG: 5-formyltetrahydrofolate cyclo-ligase [Gammaproteobacteria bacterium]
MIQKILRRKTELRQQLKAQRAQMPPAAREHEDQGILGALLELAPVQAARRVFCFISHGDETDTHALIDALLAQGKEIVVPKIMPQGMIAVPFSDWSELRPGQLGILTPIATTPSNESIDVCITPGLGFTESGKRLGYGRGYYDRWFAAHPVVDRIGIAYDCQIVDDLPTDGRDIPVTMLVTGKRWIKCQS